MRMETQKPTLASRKTPSKKDTMVIELASPTETNMKPHSQTTFGNLKILEQIMTYPGQ